MSAGPKQLKGKCVIQALFLPERGSFNEARARYQITPDPNNYLSQSYYQQANSNMTARLKGIMQSGGGLTPHANPYIGAPMATFVYASLAPDAAHPQLNLIKGPAADASYTDVSGVIQTYTPTFTPPASNISGITGEGSGAVDFKQVNASIPGSAQYPTVPSTTTNPALDDQTAPSPLPTYNIWQLMNANDGAITMYTENYGPKYSSQYEGARVVQNAGADGGMHLNITAPNVEAEIRRIFPISKDLMYSGASLYYPKTTSDDGFGTAPDPRPIVAKGGANCGFQMHFNHSSIGQSTNSKGELNGGIKIRWGSDNQVNPDCIERFVLHLNPKQVPELFYYDPNASEPWVKIPLRGPVFGTGQYSVYVHYNGPQMLIGFDADPSNWNAIFPPHLIDKGTLKPNSNYRFINVPEESYVSVIFTNITSTFTYGPIAFNNYHPENWKKGEDDRGRFRFSMSAPKTDVDHLSATKINEYIQNHRYLDDDYATENLATQENDPKVSSPSYYIDRRNAETNSIFYEEIDRSEDEKGEIVTVIGQVVFDTTIEGPQFHWARATKIEPKRGETPKPKKKPAFPIRSLDPWGDISSYLTSWNVDYVNESDNRCLLKGTATVTLHNLALTTQGRQILNVLKRNVTVMTLGAGYEDTKTFFQGVVTKVETQRTANGTETTVSLIDVGTYIISKIRFDQRAFFGTMKYGDIIMTVMEMGGLIKAYQEQTRSIGKEQKTEKFDNWIDALDTRLRVPIGELPLSSNALRADITMTLDSIIKSVLSLIIAPGALPSFRWDPEATEEKHFKLSWRNDSAFIDQLFFAGYRDEDNLAFLPNSDDPEGLHGVLTKEGWRDTTNLQQIYAGLKMWGRDIIDASMIYEKLSPEAYGEEAYQKLLKSVKDNAKDDDSNLKYVGAPVIYVNETKAQYLGDQKSLDTYGDFMLNEYLREPYEQIRFKVFITKPLTHFGRFYISTFFGADHQKQNDTDTYYYQSVSYTFSKAEGILTANIVGEVIPSQILQGMELSSTLGVDVG